MVNQVTVFVPASIANLGCGFDIMGMAVESAGDILSMEMSDGDGIEIINRTDYDIPASVEDNVMTPSIRAMLAAAGVRKHLKITLMCKIMPGSGIGSSAASAAGEIQPKQQYSTPFHSNWTSPPRRIHCLKSLIVLNRLSSRLFVPTQVAMFVFLPYKKLLVVCSLPN